MKSLPWVFAPVLSLALLGLTAVAQAMPAGGPKTGAVESQVIQVHGCHRSCEWGRVLRWHRHGAACRPIKCWPRAVYPNRCWVDAYGVRRCRW